MNKLRLALLALSLVTTSPANAATTGALDGVLSYGATQLELQSTPYCSPPYSCERVPTGVFPGQQVTDAAALAAWIEANPDARIVVGHSYGGEVVDRLQREYAEGLRPVPDRPGLVFVTYGDPEHRFNGVAYVANANNGCNCGVGLPSAPVIQQIAVSAQYDFFADFPNVPSSPYYGLAIMNAFAGIISRHLLGYLNMDPLDPTLPRYVDTDGTTYVFLPTKGLPILFGLPNEALQADIETAYSRPPYQTSTSTAQEAAPSTASISIAPQSTAALSPPARGTTTTVSKPRHTSVTSSSTSPGRKTHTTKASTAVSAEPHGKTSSTNGSPKSQKPTSDHQSKRPDRVARTVDAPKHRQGKGNGLTDE